MLSEYRSHPDDYLLRVGYGGVLGPLTNIDQQGFASVAFHSFPSTLKWDAYSGDYGPNFFGHAMNTATYLIDHPEFGWQAYGGNVQTEGGWVRVQPRDSFRARVYIAPRGLWLTLDAGTFESVEVSRQSHAVRVSLAPAAAYTPQALLRVEQPAKSRRHQDLSSGRADAPSVTRRLCRSSEDQYNLGDSERHSLNAHCNALCVS